MDIGDKFDKAFIPDQKKSLIWAMADISTSRVKHNVAKGEGILTLAGRTEDCDLNDTYRRRGEWLILHLGKRRTQHETLICPFTKTLQLAYLGYCSVRTESHGILLGSSGSVRSERSCAGVGSSFINQTMQEAYKGLLEGSKASTPLRECPGGAQNNV